MNSVIITAGGTGSRFSETESKLLFKFKDSTVIEETIKAFFNHHLIAEIVLAYPIDKASEFKKISTKFKSKLSLTPGGKSRAESVKNAFMRVSKESKNILIHDGARPNVNDTLISEIINELNHHPMVIPGIPVTDTIKVISGKKIKKTLDRKTLTAVQTPQGFHKNILIECYEQITNIDQFTDEASLVESIGIKGIIVPGSSKNIKITEYSDIAILNSFINV